MRHAYLRALEDTGCVQPQTGWQPQHLSLWQGDRLVAACPLYLKAHSYGEYVFDWAWARAYEQHGLAYYPKALVAVPFTPVPGSRFLAQDPQARTALAQALQQWVQAQGLSSAHVLYGDAEDAEALNLNGWLPRQQIQFHWHNAGWPDFEAFLSQLQQAKRKKIKQERQKVAAQGVGFSVLEGQAIDTAAWDFFYRCYAQTYWEHGNPPYLSRSFFEELAQHHPDQWVLFIAHRNGQPMACSLVGLHQETGGSRIAYGRYWGALERVDCLHFEACYYQPIAWCIANGVQRFEGGAQGEHKMARALLPTATASWHWVADPRFRAAIHDFVERESDALHAHQQALQARSPFRSGLE
jgi:predicted N-acyltransferase